MTNSKKLSMFIFSLLLVVASLLFVACGENDYSNVSISSSQETVELVVGEENSQNITFTINNPVRNMESGFVVQAEDDGVYSVQLQSSVSYSSTYTITGLKGGTSTITVRTREGNISKSVRVNVRQYSDGLTSASNSLYVSLSSELIPSSADFVFSDNTTERDLNYYFYGQVNSDISLDDVIEGENYINQFVSVNLINLNSLQYLIFEDEQGALFTLGQGESVSDNVKYDFIEVELENGQYLLDENASSVMPGQRFSFIAVNENISGEPLYCQRDFIVITDINSESISHDVGYRIVGYNYSPGSDYSYKLPESEGSDITLIPNYTSTIENGVFIGEEVNYVTAYVEVSINSESDLLRVSSSTENVNVINTLLLSDPIRQNGVTTYYYQIDCATSQGQTTNFNLTFYYDGFEDSEDENVNFTYSIPVNIRIIPTNVLANDIDLLNSEEVFTFYDVYYGDYGWQRFLFTLNPANAEYDSISIDLTNTDLELRYNGSEPYRDQIVEIDDLSEPIYLRGIDGANITDETQALPITLNFNVLQEDSIEVNLLYEIVHGVTDFDYTTDDYRSGIYVDLNGGDVAFTDIYADVSFSNAEISLNNNSADVANIYFGNPICTQQGQVYLLNLMIEPTNVGTGVYTITLDNGKTLTITITVVESLQNVSISSQNVQNTIRYIQQIEDEDYPSTLLYVYNNGNNSYFDVSVMANGGSNAINSVQFSFTSQLIRLDGATNNNKNFNVYVLANGASTLELRVSGYAVNNFRRESITILYYIDIIGFSYIDNLNVYKEHDGRGDYIDDDSDNESIRNYGVSAAYADVYSGTNNTDARSAAFNVTVSNDDAFLFALPSTIRGGDIEYAEQSFSVDFIYWETDWTWGITKDGTSVDIMYFEEGGSNIYTLTGVGTFDTSTMTFTALPSVADQRNFKLIAHVRQYGRVYSYTINIRVSTYEDVQQITLQESITSLEFTSTERTHSLIAYATNLNTATNAEITAFIEGGVISVSNGDGTTSTYSMFDENSIVFVESDGRYQIILTVSEQFIEFAESYDGQMSATLIIVATDWLDENGNILTSYENVVIEIPVNFANGTPHARFTIEDADDLLNMNLSAHYQITSSIDVSSISASLPLGTLSGSIIGTGQYAEITGINITNAQTLTSENGSFDYYGLFTSIAEGAYIEYIAFSGELNVGSETNFAPLGSYIGLVAGVNYGDLINIGVTLNSSSVYITSGYVGGVVGYNYGNILQDYTLFEDDSSVTRSLTASQLENANNDDSIVGAGRYSYAGMNPKILLYMNGTVTINYLNSNFSSETYIGGVSGANGGLIRKVDSTVLNFTGYTNYMAYALLQANPIYSSQVTVTTNITYVGGLTGFSTSSSTIDSGYNLYRDSVVTLTKYYNYVGANLDNTENDYNAGKGIVVGGEVRGYDYIGGVVGYIESVGDSGMQRNNFTGITSRTNVRGYLAQVSGATTAQVAGIANIRNTTYLNTAFAMQAVDSGNSGINASMIVLYNNSIVNSYFDDPTTYQANSDKLAFGNLSGNNVDIMQGADSESGKPYTNVYTFNISREQIEIPDGQSSMTITSFNRTSYYGDFIIVGDNGNTLLGQSFFTLGDDELLSVNAKYNNRFIADNGTGRQNIYYMFYFQAMTDGSQDYQSLLDEYLNYVDFNSVLYPFTTNGEITFTSNSRDILTIDQNGRINVKSTGLAQITATSVLNSNNALEFYIYVVNYFNPDEPSFTQSDEEDYQENSIIYPNGSSNSTPINNVTINMRGENSTNFYVRPFYSLNLEILDVNGDYHTFQSDQSGVVLFNNVVFNLAQNTLVTAEITQISRQEDDDTVDAMDELDIDITGQNITIRRNSGTLEADYKLTIVPKLTLIMTETDNYGNREEVFYSSSVNKTLDNVIINYRHGATNINNTRYNNVPIISSQQLNEVIVVNSTAEEDEPYYYIVSPNGEILQGDEELASIFALEYLYDNEDGLFNVSFTTYENNQSNLSAQQFGLTITINKFSPLYLDRYNQTIYGDYTIYIFASSNTLVYTTFIINFEQTNIMSVSIDNYTNISESTGSAGLSSTSEIAVPGVTGLLSITVSPDDSDFDYILIENAQSNYQSGNSVATFGLVARNANTLGSSNIFSDETILGSSTTTGIRLNLEDIIDVYGSQEEGENLYYTYNGVIYIKYDLGSYNVVDGSTTTFVISLVKDGVVYTVNKNLTVRLQNYVAVEIDGKEPTSSNTDGYYAQYNVARGMRYRLNINSYGYELDNITPPTVSDSSLATIVEEDGEYYLEITSSTIDYTNGRNTFTISISASQQEGDIQRQSSSETLVTISEYVINYDSSVNQDADIVSGMGNGEINIQVGTQYSLEIDLYDYIEYNENITSVTNSIDLLMSNLSYSGNWVAYTNLITDTQPDYSQAEIGNGRRTYSLGYDDGNALSVSNYYFSSEGLDILPLRTHLPESRYYFFTYDCFVVYDQTSGTYTVVDEGANTIEIDTTFVLNVYSSSSEESPLPIYDYDDLMDMQSGGYYILLNDITLPNTADEENGVEAFTPISVDIASFDGNGHTINFAGTYDMGSRSRIGLFESLSSGSIIRNLNVNFTSATDGSDLNIDQDDEYGWYGLRTVKFITSASSFNFGGIVVENNGIITNCNVTTDEVNGSEYYVVVRADNALNGSSYMAGISAINIGYITNCSVSINMKTPYNMAGIVGQNSNKIASTYFKDGSLINNSQQDQHIAGFVVNNMDNGQIITSYVAGQTTSDSIYSKDSESQIISSLASAGFVYQNYGNISDCYTDIDLSSTTADMAGFVYQNAGQIKNSFSLCKLRNNIIASAGFARYNTLEGQSGTFENCYYFYNERTDAGDGTSYTNDEGFIYGEDDINTSIVPVNYSGITRLNAGGFANLEENFSSYAYQETMGVESIWFYSTGNTSSTFVEYIPTTERVELPGEDGNTQSNTIYTTQLSIFAINRLELVSPNVDALSIRNFSYSEVDEATGEVTYHYVDDTSAPNRGSLHNPRLLYNAENFESEINEQTSATGLNTSYYRMVSDISYSNYEGLASTYQTVYAGVLEGNGMEISQISLVSMSSLTNAGLFAQIGYSASRTGSVKNLIITPSQVAFTNTNSVGTLAGTLRYGYLYDITINDNSENEEGISDLVVVGRNFVGGVVGRAIGNYDMKNITSSINTSATYTSSSTAKYSESATSLATYSYAGGVAGFLGSGNAYNLNADNVGSVVGSRAGFAVGGIGNNGNIQYVYVNVMTGSRIRAYHYGGYVTGEISGTLDYTQVYGSGNVESTFSVVPRSANAVGGIAGIISGGTIKNAVMEQSFRATAISTSNAVISSVGGIVGIVDNAENSISFIKDSIVDAQLIEGSSIVGGGVGQVSNSLQIEGLAVKADTISITGEKQDPIIAGIVGYNESSLTILNSYSTSHLEITTNTSGLASTASAGGLVGMSENTPNLAYCYTTSTIDAEVVDLRSLDETSDYSVYASAGNATASFTYSTTRYNNGSAYNNVYYLGHNTYTTNDESLTAYQLSRSYNITFSTKVRNSQIGLAVNNYGVSSLELTQNQSQSTQEGAFYNLFNSTYLSRTSSIDDTNSPTSIVYNAQQDSYIVDNRYTLSLLENNIYRLNSDISNFVTTQNAIVDENNTIEGQVSTSRQQTLYIRDDGTKYIYIVDSAGRSGFVREDEILSTSGTYELLTSLSEGVYTIKTTNILQNTQGLDTTYILNGVNYTYRLDRNNTYMFVSDSGDVLLDFVSEDGSANVQVTLDLNSSELLHQGIYTNGENYYQHTYVQSTIVTQQFREAYVNLATGQIYYADEFDSTGLRDVWIYSNSGLSRLWFEEDLDWIRTV